MNNKIINRQIPIQKIIDVANYLEDYKEKYDQVFRAEEINNRDLEYHQKSHKYENSQARVKYTITLHNGKTMTESDYNWFIGNTREPRLIKDINIDLSISFFMNNNINNEYNKIGVSIEFKDASMNLKYSDVIVDVETKNQEKEADTLYSAILNILEDTEERYDKTIKNRKVRMQCFCISIGIVLSYILYLILQLNINNIPSIMAQYLSNKNILVFGQWFVAILLGNVTSYWYILALYKPLLPNAKYAGYNSSNYKSKYKDDLDEYFEHSEVHIGKFWDAGKRRNKIEKIYKITSKIILMQLLISIALFFILK